MADQHDKSKKPEDATGKEQPGHPPKHDLEIPEHHAGEPEVVDEVVEVVEDVPTVQAAKAPGKDEPPEEVIEVVGAGPSRGTPGAGDPTSDISVFELAEEMDDMVEVQPDSGKKPGTHPEIALEVEEGPAEPPAKPAEPESKKTPASPKEPPKTHVPGKSAVPTMLSGTGTPHSPSDSGKPPAEDLDISSAEEFLEAEEASDPRMQPGGPPAGSQRPPDDTSSEIALSEQALQGMQDLNETPPSSATIAAALAEAPDMREDESAEDRAKTGEAEKPPVLQPPKQDSHKKLANPSQAEVILDYEEAYVDGSSEIDLGKGPGGKGERPSGVDIIPEALESGVDVDRGKAERPQAGRELTDSDLAYEAILGEAAESSAIDLGSGSGKLPGLPAGSAEKQAKKHEGPEGPGDEQDLVGEEALAVDSDDEILVTPKNKPAAAVATDWDQERSAATEETMEQEAASGRRRAGGDEGGTATIAKSRKGSRVLPYVAGGGLAVLLGALSGVATWYLMPEKKSTTGVQGLGSMQKGVEASNAQKARDLIDQGKYDEAIELVKDEKAGPELTALGLAKFKKLEKEAKAPLKSDDPNVAAALKQIEEGGGKVAADDIRKSLELDNKLGKQLADAKTAEQKAKQLEVLLKEYKLPVEKTDELKLALSDLFKAWDATGGTMKALADAKLIDQKKGLDPVAINEALKNLIAARNDFTDKLAKVNETLTKVNSTLSKAGVKDGDVKGVQELATLRDAATKERDALNTAVDAALKELKEGNYAVPGGDKTQQLIESTKKARLAGQSPLGSSLGAMVNALSGLSKTPVGIFQKVIDTSRMAADLKATQVQLALSDSPEHRLDTMVLLLNDRGFKDAKELAVFKNYVEWVRSKDSKASPQARAKALYVAALMERNQDQFAAARKTLEETLKETKGLKGGTAVQAAAAQTLKELTDPAAYYLPRAERKVTEGQFKPALADLTAALKALPDDPRLLLKRAEVELQAAESKGKIDPDTQKRIRADAEAARKDPKFAAESFYIVGRLDEHNSDWSKAEENYRQAVKLGGDSSESERYRIALARVLQRERSAATQPEESPVNVEILDLTWCSAPLEGGDDEDLMAAKRLQESIVLAKQLIESSNPKARGEGYMILGTAQARLGKKTEGLKNFVKGLELVYPGMATQDLTKIIESHPAFAQPDVALQTNPILAERHFGMGLDYFWAKKYASAEEEFKMAVSFFDQDARYRYFLGLARYLQNSREKRTLAEYDFEQGARLEMARRPSTREINASLERIQGDLRRVLNVFRDKMVTAG